jgi:CelD/BcsL family acetyltransferase involved in cellulose biosynthesis
MSQVIRTEVLTHFSQVEELASEWDRLWNANPRREIFGRFAWARAWWQAYGGCHSVCAPAVFRGDRLLGILPLVVREGTLRFLGAPYADYSDLLCDPDADVQVLESALAALCSLKSAWDRCVLENVPEKSYLVTRLPELSATLRCRTRLAFSAPCPSVVLDGNRDEILRSILSKSSLRRHHNALRRIGTLGFRHIVDREEIRLHLPTFFQQHIARRAMAGSESLFSQEKARTFFHALPDQLDPRTELRFSVLEVNGTPIAYHLGFELQRKFIWYVPTFDINLWKCSPGEVLIKSLFEYIASRDIREFDFTRGGEGFKERFANSVKKNFALHLYPPRPRGRAIQLYHIAKEQTKVQFEKTPRLLSLVRSLRLGGKKAYRRFTTTLHSHDLLTLAAKLLRGAIRTIVFAHDKVLVFSCYPTSNAVSNELLKIHRGTLSDLAHISVEFPGHLGALRLHTALKRFDSGDSLYIARDVDGVAGIAWMGCRKVISTSEASFEFQIHLDEAASFIYNWWLPSRARGGRIFTAMLCEFLQREIKEDRQTWICCRADDSYARQSIETAGFQLRHVVRRIRILHWFIHSWAR